MLCFFNKTICDLLATQQYNTEYTVIFHVHFIPV